MRSVIWLRMGSRVIMRATGRPGRDTLKLLCDMSPWSKSFKLLELSGRLRRPSSRYELKLVSKDTLHVTS